MLGAAGRGCWHYDFVAAQKSSVGGGRRRVRPRGRSSIGPAAEQLASPKTLSDRIGHANMSVTLQIYGHRSHGRDQAMAQNLGDLIQSATDVGEARAARLVTDLVTVPLRPPKWASLTHQRATPKNTKNRPQGPGPDRKPAGQRPRRQKARTIWSGSSVADALVAGAGFEPATAGL